MDELPVVIVGDVHGDIERLFQALHPFDPTRTRTIFLGDLVDGGPFGVGCLRYARDRPNSELLIGNHEALMLAALNDADQRHRWLNTGGEKHDLDELRKHPDLEEWLRTRPAMLLLSDGTLVQHADNDGYWRLAGEGSPESVNAAVKDILTTNGREAEVWDAISPKNVFDRVPGKVEKWLERMSAIRVVHGHSPHKEPRPRVYAGGRAINFDGGLGRYGRSRYRKQQPVQASVGRLDLVVRGEPRPDRPR